MLKLTCNALGDLGLFLHNKGRKIEWKFITLLHEEQTKNGLKFGNNFSGRHIEYFRNKMNVVINYRINTIEVFHHQYYLYYHITLHTYYSYRNYMKTLFICNTVDFN